MRLVAWAALSNLFLDTDLDDRDIEAIARELRATGYPASELERIYEQEVAPVCWRNLGAVPGGVWTGFDRDWLAGEVRKHLQHPGIWNAVWPIRTWQIGVWTRLSRPDWNRVKARL
ncbi:MAG: hypothetical protein HGA75_07675 [Thiobacillus sp.]|nr:hypothetical protein [Thiobacillus sp.]